MTTGQLITYTDLTLLGNVNLSHLQDAVWQLITDGDCKLLTLHLGIKQLILLHEVDNQLGNELVFVLIIGPVANLYVTILKVAQGCSSKLATLGDNLSTCIVLNALRCLTLGQLHELVDQDILQVVNLSLVLLVDLSQHDLILLLRLTVLDSTLEHLLVNNNTAQ